MIHLHQRPSLFIRAHHAWAGAENGVWWKLNNWPTTTKGEAMKTTEKKIEKIGRREFYLAVARSTRFDMNPLQTILRAGLKILAGYDDATILRLVRGK